MRFSPTMLQVHHPKTGGTWAARVFERLAGGRIVRTKSEHDPAWFVPEAERAERMVWGTIRDPWSWYASLYAHAHRAELVGQHERDLRLWGNGSTEFRDVLFGWTHPEQVETIPTSCGVIWGCFDGSPRHLARLEMGFASWAVLYTYGEAKARKHPWGDAGWAVDALITTDRLTEGASLILGDGVYGFPAVNTRAQNGGGREAYADLYDAKMVSWVASRDASLISLGGWSAPFSPAPQALIEMVN